MYIIRTIDRYLYELFLKLPHLPKQIRLSLSKDLWLIGLLFLILFGFLSISYIISLVSYLYINSQAINVAISNPIDLAGVPGRDAGVVVIVLFIAYLLLVTSILARSVMSTKKGFREGWLGLLGALFVILIGLISSVLVGFLMIAQVLSLGVVSILLIYILYETRRDFSI